MPFTPFHMGPGLLVKSLLGGAFSLIIFGWCQVLMDLQPLIVFVTGEGQLHGFTHTFIGSTLIAIVAVLSGKPLLAWLVDSRWLEFRYEDKVLFSINSKPGWIIAAVSSLIGSYSHVLLDAIMHTDVQPYYPVSLENPHQGWMTIDRLHDFCIYSGLLGLLILLVFGARRKMPVQNAGEAE